MNQLYPLFKNRCYWLDLKFTLENSLEGLIFKNSLILFNFTCFILFFSFFEYSFRFFLFFTLSRLKSDFYVNKALLPSESTLLLSLHELRLSPLIY